MGEAPNATEVHKEKVEEPKEVYPAFQRPYYTPLPYYPQPQTTQKNKKSRNIIIVVVAIFLIILYIGGGIFFLIINPGTDEITKHYSFDVIIGQNGHYRHSIGEYWCEETEIEFNITSENNSNFDVYIMDKDQFENSYNVGNFSGNAFSTIYAWEDVNEVKETIKTSENYYREVYLIIDNKDEPLTSKDANPTGIISVTVKIDITEEVSWD
jgi:hypothetical protein